jgi:hypothetical protein
MKLTTRSNFLQAYVVEDYYSNISLKLINDVYSACKIVVRMHKSYRKTNNYLDELRNDRLSRMSDIIYLTIGRE